MSEQDPRSIFIAGLKNAHAMENQALSIMRPQVERIENYPEVAAKLRQHITETEGQIKRLETILDSLGENHSMIKDAGLAMAGTAAALAHTAAPDEIVKNSIANYAFENFESAAYKSLLTLARIANVPSAEEPLRANLAEEEAMAEWLDQNLEAVTMQYATLRAAGETAKK